MEFEVTAGDPVKRVRTVPKQPNPYKPAVDALFEAGTLDPSRKVTITANEDGSPAPTDKELAAIKRRIQACGDLYDPKVTLHVAHTNVETGTGKNRTITTKVSFSASIRTPRVASAPATPLTPAAR